MRFLLFLCLLRGMLVNGSLIAASKLLVPDLNTNASLKLQDLTHSTAQFSAARPGLVLKRGEIFPPRAPVPSNPLNFLDPVDLGNPDNFATLNGPMLRSNWDDHCIEKLRAKRAFLEALQLARTALDYMERSTVLGGLLPAVLRRRILHHRVRSAQERLQYTRCRDRSPLRWSCQSGVPIARPEV